jgi:hypothetical protein
LKDHAGTRTGSYDVVKRFRATIVFVRLRGRPTLTFLWGDMAWRRYVSDPMEDINEPKVYLAGAGDVPSEIDESGRQLNARMDYRGRLTLGVQAR